jgi:hypothetical protein
MRKYLNIINEAAVRLSYEHDGFPTELHDQSDVVKAIKGEHISHETMITIFRDGEKPTLLPAADVPEIAKHLPTPAKERQVLTVTSTLETIRTTDIRTKEGAQQMLDALHRLVLSVDHFVGHDISMTGAMNKAISRAETLFPRDIDHLMKDQQALRKIKNGLNLIRAALSRENIVMENQIAETYATDAWSDEEKLRQAGCNCQTPAPQPSSLGHGSVSCQTCNRAWIRPMWDGPEPSEQEVRQTVEWMSRDAKKFMASPDFTDSVEYEQDVEAFVCSDPSWVTDEEKDLTPLGRAVRRYLRAHPELI